MLTNLELMVLYDEFFYNSIIKGLKTNRLRVIVDINAGLLLVQYLFNNLELVVLYHGANFLKVTPPRDGKVAR